MDDNFSGETLVNPRTANQQFSWDHPELFKDGYILKELDIKVVCRVRILALHFIIYNSLEFKLGRYVMNILIFYSPSFLQEIGMV